MFFNLNLNQEIEDLPQTNKTILDEHLLFNSTIYYTKYRSKHCECEQSV